MLAVSSHALFGRNRSETGTITPLSGLIIGSDINQEEKCIFSFNLEDELKLISFAKALRCEFKYYFLIFYFEVSNFDRVIHCILRVVCNSTISFFYFAGLPYECGNVYANAVSNSSGFFFVIQVKPNDKMAKASDLLWNISACLKFYPNFLFSIIGKFGLLDVKETLVKVFEYSFACTLTDAHSWK
ncbi:MAG: hypothetical protein AAF546_03990 [Verrucomicrobiota bacterium]